MTRRLAAAAFTAGMALAAASVTVILLSGTVALAASAAGIAGVACLVAGCLAGGGRADMAAYDRASGEPDFGDASAAYASAFTCGDSDAFTGLAANWSRWSDSTVTDAYSADRTLGYADGYSQQIASQEGAQS
jgi:hypothetical protein